MKNDFPYPGYEQSAPVKVPDANLPGVDAPRPVGRAGGAEMLARGFRTDAYPADALALAFEGEGERATVAVLRRGGRALPLVAREERAA